MRKEKYAVTGMTCSACSSHVEKSVCKLPGMDEVTVNLLTNSMQVVYDEALCTESQIIDAVEKAGYGASLNQADRHTGRGDSRDDRGGTADTKGQLIRESLKGKKENKEMKAHHFNYFHAPFDDCIYASYVLYVAASARAGIVHEAVSWQ